MRIVGALVVLGIVQLATANCYAQQRYRHPPPRGDDGVVVNTGGTEVNVGGPVVNVAGDEADNLSLDAGDTAINVPESAPSFGVAGVYSSHPCVLGWSGTLSVVGGGIGGGKQRVDPECNLREWSRLLAAYGWLDSVHEIVCSSEDVSFIARCLEPYQAVEIPPPYMAEVSDEEFEAVQEQAEMVQYRVEEQASLIATLEEQQALKDAEITRLRAEASRLAAAQEAEHADKVDRQVSLSGILERLNARIEEEAEAKE